ncbi:hypothetical protein [Rhodopirellula baltica]|uniref:Uncharacterized protein n=1 Tax=Rhodopirellula baltica SWK14 TaxID=993516 RepID=L7CBH8_RHOBT|nr:hypothetical protein [Rhodopirellula baltica]ELP30977.1 hypothetical protein RBSWK_05088 [Rhodopirellula baltica SWK14]
MKRQAIAYLSAVVLLAILLVPLVRSIRPAYHRYRFDSAQNATLNGDEEQKLFGLFNNGFDSLDHHLEQLVAIDAVRHASFTMPNILNDSSDRKALAEDMLANNCPPFVYWSSAAPSNATPMILDVWCEHDDFTQWTAYLTRFDPDVVIGG